MKLVEKCFGKQALKPAFLCRRRHDTCADKRDLTREQVYNGASVCSTVIFLKAFSARDYILYHIFLCNISSLTVLVL